MLEADLRVVVVTPRQVKSLRSRYRASGERVRSRRRLAAG
jgi:hypothetical protein